MKRFYKEAVAASASGGEGWRVLLDGRPIRTAGGREQVVPSRALANALAGEWAAQGEKLDPRGFPLRDLSDFALDAVAPARGDAIDALMPYADTDTLCYRADPEDALLKRQDAVWEPLLQAHEAALGARFTRVCGLMHRAHPAETLERVRARLEALGDFDLAALRMLASLAASMGIALAALEPGADAKALWGAANLEEDWQAELWGRDDEAETLRQTRFEAFALAMRFAALARAK
jgi:chaperone required for assembly of F1-ATPase